MLAATAKGRVLMGGSAAMRDAGKTYLPRFEAESEDGYKARLAASWLFNGYRKTVRDLTGKVFAKPVETDAAGRMAAWLDDADMQGRDLSTFARAVFEDAISGPGIAWIMVDAPARTGGETQAQAAAGGLRPYLVHLGIEEVIGWKTARVANRTVVSQVRLAETVTEPDPKDEFAEVKVEQVRVLDRTENGVQTRLFRKQAGKGDWQEWGEPTFSGLTEITIAPVYLTRTGFWTAEPPLDDLADVNVAHWQSQSDQRNILHVARVPILFATGRTQDDGALTIGAPTAVLAADPNADLKWVEHTGAAIDAGRQDLKDLEFQMEAHGLQLLVARPGGQSATGEALDAEKETSTLAMMADALKDALEQAIGWMGEYAGEAAPVAVTVNTDFGVGLMTPQEMTAMLSAVNSGNLSRETFLREMARRGVIAGDIDPDEEAERIEAEGGGMEEMEPAVVDQ